MSLFPYKAKLAEGDEDRLKKKSGPEDKAPDLHPRETLGFQHWFEKRKSEPHAHDDYRTAWSQAYKWKRSNERLRDAIEQAVIAIECLDTKQLGYHRCIFFVVKSLKNALDKNV